MCWGYPHSGRATRRVSVSGSALGIHGSGTAAAETRDSDRRGGRDTEGWHAVQMWRRLAGAGRAAARHLASLWCATDWANSSRHCLQGLCLLFQSPRRSPTAPRPPRRVWALATRCPHGLLRLAFKRRDPPPRRRNWGSTPSAPNRRVTTPTDKADPDFFEISAWKVVASAADRVGCVGDDLPCADAKCGSLNPGIVCPGNSLYLSVKWTMCCRAC